MTSTAEPILDIGALVIDAAPRPSSFDRWFDTSVRVDAHPFSGVVETIFTDVELGSFADQLERPGPGAHVLGGGRACEVRLDVDWVNGVEDGRFAIECTVTPSGDDPFPLVRYLVFDVDPSFGAVAAERIRGLVRLNPWPRP